ncbi:hypothetical protein AADZ91_09620 [Colwelliaceae bacterium 6441]
MKVLIKSLLAIVLIVVFTSLIVVYYALQASPSTVQVNQINASSAKESQQLVKRLVSTLKENNSVSTIEFSQQEINGLCALLHRAFPRVTADVLLSNHAAAAKASIALPLPSFIQYLNVNAYLLPSKQGLVIDEIVIGDISVDGDFFISLVTFFADTFIKEDLVDKALTMIDSVDINEQRMITKLLLNKALITSKEDESLFISLRDDLALFGNVETISFYYESLSEFAQQQNKRTSIARFVKFLFELAKTRSSISEEYLAVNENQAAITALVIYFGADRFELLVGDVIIRDHAQLVVRNRLRNHVTLQNRPDLQKHFIYSMALQLFSSHGASDAIGEFKEFLDTNKGGSGFSFADLQADRAGTRLAMIVTKSEHQAKQAQSILSTITDEQLLPSIKGLEEGLNETSFEKKFKNVNSIDYQQTLKEIDNRLKSLPVYQLGWE